MDLLLRIFSFWLLLLCLATVAKSNLIQIAIIMDFKQSRLKMLDFHRRILNFRLNKYNSKMEIDNKHEIRMKMKIKIWIS